MRNTLASLLLLVLAVAARAADPAADLELFRKRYVAKGHPDPATELKAALGAADDAWTAEIERARLVRAQDSLPVRDDDALGALRIGRVMPKLLAAAGPRYAGVRTEILRSDEFNAFTYGGDRIYMTDTMLGRLNDGELATVLAHELSHIMAWHGARRQAFSRRLQAPAGETMLAMRLYSRLCEAEADALALVLLDRAGLKPALTHFELFAATSADLRDVESRLPAARAAVERLESEEIRLNAELNTAPSQAVYERLGRLMEELAAARERLQVLHGQRAFLTLASQHTHPDPADRVRFCEEAASGGTTDPLIRYVLDTTKPTLGSPSLPKR